MAAISTTGNIVFGSQFVINYSDWTGTPNGDVRITAGNYYVDLVGSVSGTTSGTVTATMPSLPSSGGIDAVAIGAVSVRLQ